MNNILDYIYTILYQYVTLDNIVVVGSIVLLVLVLGAFWKSEARNKVFQVLGDLNRRYKNLE